MILGNKRCLEWISAKSKKLWPRTRKYFTRCTLPWSCDVVKKYSNSSFFISILYRFTHHLTKEKRNLLRDRGTIIPLLSTVEHIFRNEESLSDCQEEIKNIYQKKVRLCIKHTCLYFQALWLLWFSHFKNWKDWQYSHFFTSQETF